MSTLEILLWKNLRWQLHGHYCHLTELQPHNPKLASLIEHYASCGADFWCGKYIYHLTKSKHIHRKPDFLKTHGHDEPTEKLKKRQLVNQTRF